MRARLLAVSILILGCGGTGDAVVTTTDVADVTASVEVVAEVSAPLDVAHIQVPDLQLEPDLVIFDSGPEILEPQCAPGEGCFLDKCDENVQCASGWCVEHMGEGVCSKACQEECPTGWSCKQVGADGPDIQYICVSQHANLCRPCASGSECKSPGGAEDVCIDYDEEGSFCGGACTVDDDCPWGFSCLTTVTVDGISTSQCVADAGACPCTEKSVLLALWTPCELSNEWGTCSGKRVCGAEGLSDCDAGIAAEETCDGIDNDCDGDIDEPIMDPPTSLCDDGNPCTVDTCDGADGCAHETLTQGECIDGDSCTVGDHCEAGICVGSPVDCDDSNPCTDDSCDGFGGCNFENNVVDCDDSDPCTVADECNGGLCAGFAIACDCQDDSDCVALEDGDLCNGTLFCDQTQLPYQCQIDLDSLVECPNPTPGPNAPCLVAACDGQTGDCGLLPANDGLGCSDGDSCTVGDLCDGGVCVAGVAALCADNNLCTDDSCDPESGCEFVDNTASCNDGNACTIGDECDAGQCAGGAALECDDGNLCTDDGCDSESGCQAVPNEANCDDGNACTTGDICGGGSCGFVGFLDCDDDNPCTKDGCDPQLGCTHDLLAVACSDGDPCTVGDMCDNGLCVSGAALDCEDFNPCTDDSCDETGACVHVPNEAPCSDGNACTKGDKCEGGDCVFAGLEVCDDDNVCTADSCDPSQGCLHLLNEAPCDDGDVCTTGDHCHLGFCIAAGDLTCDDGNNCTDDSCEALTGCSHLPNTQPCDDGNVCTEDDACAAGQCSGGSMVLCDDGNECTANFCNIAQGCVTVSKTGLCDDDNECTVESVCSEGTCGGGIPFTCDDGNGCTDDSCDPDDGCIFTNNEAACSDDDACTTGDACSAGSCQSGGPTDCDDSKVCTDDSCNVQSGCVHTSVADETGCGADKHCLAGECVDDCTGTQTFNYTGGVQTFAVPDCVASVTINVWGGEGGVSDGRIGGEGGHSQGVLAVNGGETLYIYVGEKGHAAPNGVGGWNGGGLGNTNEFNRGAGGGGGTDVRKVGGAWNNGASLNSRVIVAGGGGGGWGYTCCNPGVGGHGGGTTGGTAPSGGGADAGGQNGSGCCGGAGFGVGGSNHTYGGGGGGWWGGGSANGCCAGAGAGGSGYVGGVSNGSTSTGGNTGNGKVTIVW